jgi:hypothetical protein
MFEPALLSSGRARLGAAWSLCGWSRWPQLEAATEREMEIHALHALLGLYPDERRAHGGQRKLTRHDETLPGATSGA